MSIKSHISNIIAANITGTPGKAAKNAGVGTPIKSYAQIELDPDTGEMTIRTNAPPLMGLHMSHGLAAKFLSLLSRQQDMEAQARKAQEQAAQAGQADLPIQ